jgi:hypothetical protein
MLSTPRLIARWSATPAGLLCIPFAIQGSFLAGAALVIILPLTLVAWWPPTGRTTDDSHCSECGYPFPGGAERRCPECGSID